MSTAPSDDFADATEYPSDWEPSPQECREMIDAENDARYEAWITSDQPFDLTGESYLGYLAEYLPTRSPSEWDLRLEEQIDGAYEGMVAGRSATIFDRGDLDWMADFDERCFESPDHLSDAYEGIHETGIRVDILAAGRLLGDRDPTFWPRLRKLGPTPELVKEANTILGGHEFEREAKNRTRPKAVRPVAQRRICSRARSSRGAAPGRRQGSRRATARAGPSDDDGEPAPPGLRPWRRPHLGSCSPNPLRVLLREARS